MIDPRGVKPAEQCHELADMHLFFITNVGKDF